MLCQVTQWHRNDPFQYAQERPSGETSAWETTWEIFLWMQNSRTEFQEALSIPEGSGKLCRKSIDSMKWWNASWYIRLINHVPCMNKLQNIKFSRCWLLFGEAFDPNINFFYICPKTPAPKCRPGAEILAMPSFFRYNWTNARAELRGIPAVF